MTDAEKLLQTMMMLAQENKENQQAELNKAANHLKMMYDAYIQAGFSYKMAFELTKTMLASIVTGVTKK
jgi:hypothetical protein